MEICKTCACDCQPVSNNCIATVTNMDVKAITPSTINNTNQDIGELIGFDCADAMCMALKEAAQQVEDNGGVIEDYLSQKWIDILTNQHFKSWYSYKVFWHFLRGTSISDVKGDSLIVESNNDPNYSGSFAAAQEKERQRLQQAAQTYIDQYSGRFLERFWYKNIDSYDCAVKQCGCSKNYTCETHCKQKQPRIGGFVWNGNHRNRW